MLQELLGLPEDRWDFGAFYSEKPKDTDLFLCKVLPAGAVAIYLDLITKMESDKEEREENKKDSIKRAIHIFNTFLKETSGDRGHDSAEFDPFRCDEYLGGTQVDEQIRKTYSEKVKKLFTAFQAHFGVRDCVDILGFDPFRYEEYDEETQERIEEGEWMEKCCECMENVIRTIHEME